VVGLWSSDWTQPTGEEKRELINAPLPSPKVYSFLLITIGLEIWNGTAQEVECAGPQ